MSGRKSKARRRILGVQSAKEPPAERVPYGYRRNPDGEIVVMPEEAAKVQRAFQLAAQGFSIRRIAEIMNAEEAEGIVTPYIPVVGHDASDLRRPW